MKPRTLTLAVASALLGAACGAASAQVPDPGAEPAPTPVLAPVDPIPSEHLGVPTPIDDPGGRALSHFYERLRTIEGGAAEGEPQARVVVYGASHVAGDLITKTVRHRLQARFGDAGPGFIVPARPWRDYNHRDANIEYSKTGWDSFWVSRRNGRDDGLYGLAGCSFASNDKKAFCKIATAEKSPHGRSASRIEVWYWKHAKGGDLYVVLDGGKKKKVKTRSKEEGPGYAVFEVPDGPHEIELRPRGNGQVLLFGVAMDRDTRGVVMDSLGINGARASAQNSWDPRLYAEHLARREPDLVVLAYGTNATGDTTDPIDAYERRLDVVVNRVRSLVPAASCLLVGPTDRPVKVEGNRDEPMVFFERPRQAQLIEVQRRVAHRYGCGYWDMVAMMGGDLSMLQWVHSEPRYGATDYVHLTRAGYERAADLFWDALMAGYEPAVAEGDIP